MRTVGPPSGGRPTLAAVVCGGGGLTGGVFEVAALRALDVALGGGVLTRLDVFAGAASGSLVATMLASGLSPQEMDDVIVRGARNRRRLPPLSRGALYRVDKRSWAAVLARAPLRGLGRALPCLLPGGDARLADAMLAALSGLPPGLLSNAPLEEYVRRVLDQLGVSQDFGGLPRRLLIAAINLDTGQRVAFGQTGLADVPIASAVRASTALPLLFRPVRIDGQDFVGGGLERNVPVELAVECGAALVIAVNPLVPLVNDPRSHGPLPPGQLYLSDRGMPAVFDQVFRMLVRSLTVQELGVVRDRFPEVDLVMLEPEPGDWTMFSYNTLRYSVRERLAAHAFATTRDRLVRDAAELGRVFARHGLDFDAQRLISSRDRRPGKDAAGTLLRRLERLPLLRRLAAEGEASDRFPGVG